MDTPWNAIIGSQCGAAIDMLEHALRACPEGLWREALWHHPGEPPEAAQFWYLAYHALFWLDLYLSGAVEGFAPPAPFTLDELDPAGRYPNRAYSQVELLTYLNHCRQKARAITAALTPSQANRRCRFPWGEVSFAELILDNMRHVQEHTAQLNLFLGQKTGGDPGWLAMSN